MGRLSQSETSVIIKSQSETSVSIKCDRYSISAIGITKWDDYHKVRQVLL